MTGVSKVSCTTEIARCNISDSLLLVGFVRSLKSLHKEALKKTLLFEDYSDLTSPTTNQIPDIHIAVSVVCDPFENKFSFILTLRGK